MSDQELAVTMQARKILHFKNIKSWVKKLRKKEWAYDGAEIREQGKYGINKGSIGLYQDDFFRILNNIQKTVDIFKEC